MLREHGELEDHEGNRISFRTDEGPVRLTTVMSEVDGHGRITLGGNSASSNIAESVIQKLSKEFQTYKWLRKYTIEPTYTLTQ